MNGLATSQGDRKLIQIVAVSPPSSAEEADARSEITLSREREEVLRVRVKRELDEQKDQARLGGDWSSPARPDPTLVALLAEIDGQVTPTF